MTRQELRNRTPKFQCANTSKPHPKKRRGLRLSTVLKVVAAGMLLAALWETSPSKFFPECRGNDVLRHCVD